MPPTQDIKIIISNAYMGGVTFKARIQETVYMLDQANIEKAIINQIKERGFNTNKTGRQTYTRLIINT